MWLLFASLTAHAGALLGVDWVPFGRGDLAWVQDGELSGTGVAETDGLIHGALTAWGGWADAHDAALLGLAGARLGTSSVSSTLQTGTSVAAFRPSLDYRRYLHARGPDHVNAYGQIGLYGVIPAARSWSNAYTDEEQAAMDTASAQTRAQIGGYGLRVGGGAELAFANGLSVGARYLGVLHQTRAAVEDTTTTSTFAYGEAAFVLGFAL